MLSEHVGSSGESQLTGESPSQVHNYTHIQSASALFDATSQSVDALI